MMKTKYSVVLKEKPLDEGLERSEVMDLFDMLKGTSGIPIEIQGEWSTSMGFIDTDDADSLGYDYTVIEAFVREILEDMDKESPDCCYTVNVPDVGNIDIWLSR